MFEIPGSCISCHFSKDGNWTIARPGEPAFQIGYICKRKDCEPGLNTKWRPREAV